MFAALARGEDLPPGQRLRAEGLAEAAVLLGASSAALDEQMDKCYQAAFGRSLAEDFGADWRSLGPFPENPAMARRAPVYPSTAD
ncbi:hypothetical protein DWB85_08590 [Seongchinamella sediminis]|uniref:Uncharacterized protein n=2 Tax=Seongchinamella sediminis TaxID=2283635 RepID=A0A3L7DXM0_9GAMM|nr:hypothetical protein DWB85_08590 [Seongchinamella sediminis]